MTDIDMTKIEWDRIRYEVVTKLRAVQHAACKLDPPTARRLLLPTLAPLCRFLDSIHIDGDGTWPEGEPEACEVIEEDGAIRVRTSGGTH
jgi:hypothetical protein